MTAATDSNVTALVRREAAAERPPDVITSLAEIERVAKACAASGYYRDVRDASQALVKMLAGREMGIGPIQALAGIHIVEGKPSAGASLIAGNVKRSGRYDYRVVERTDSRCELEWFDRGESVGRSSFDLADAKRAGLASRANWTKYPRAMLFARALTEGVRVFCPEAASGVIYTPEELAPELEVTEDAQPAEPRVVNPTPEAQTAAPPKQKSRSRNGDAITDKQRKLLFAKAHERAAALGLDEDKAAANDILRAVLADLGWESTTEVKRGSMDNVIDGIAGWEVPREPTDAEKEVF